MASRNRRRISGEKIGGRWDPTRDGLRAIDLSRLSPDPTGSSAHYWSSLYGRRILLDDRWHGYIRRVTALDDKPPNGGSPAYSLTIRLVSRDSPIVIDPSTASRHNLKAFPSQGDRLDNSGHEYCFGKFDLVIVGGGAAGLAAATAFADTARPDSNALILEANPSQLGGRATRSVTIDHATAVNTCSWFATSSPEDSHLTFLLNSNIKIKTDRKFRWDSLAAGETGFFFGTSPVSSDLVDACFAFHQACVVGSFLLESDGDSFLEGYDRFRSCYHALIQDGNAKEAQFSVIARGGDEDRHKMLQARAVLDYMRSAEFTHTGAPDISRTAVESEYLSRKIIMSVRAAAKACLSDAEVVLDFAFGDIITVVAALRKIDKEQLAKWIAAGLSAKDLGEGVPTDLANTIRTWAQFAEEDKKGRGRPAEHGGLIHDGQQVGWGVMMSEVAKMVKNHPSRLEVICGARVRKIDGPHGVNQWTSVVWFTLPGRANGVRFVLCMNVIICLPLPIMQRADPISVLPSPMGSTALQISGIPEEELLRVREALTKLWAGFDERLVYMFDVAPWKQGDKPTPFPEEWLTPDCQNWDDLPVIKVASAACLRFVNLTKYLSRSARSRTILVACISAGVARSPQDWHTLVEEVLTGLFKGCHTIPTPSSKHLSTDSLIQTAFCKMLPGFSEELHDLQRPLGSHRGALRIAGEYTSMKAFGTVDGAWQSGHDHAIAVIEEQLEQQALANAEALRTDIDAEFAKSVEEVSSVAQSSQHASSGDIGTDIPHMMARHTMRDIHSFSYGFRYMKNTPEFDLVCPPRREAIEAQLDRDVIESWMEKVRPTYGELSKFMKALIEESAKGRNSDIVGLADFYARAIIQSRQITIEPWELSDYPDPGTMKRKRLKIGPDGQATSLGGIEAVEEGGFRYYVYWEDEKWYLPLRASEEQCIGDMNRWAALMEGHCSHGHIKRALATWR
ncbi:hypothetical protein FOL47_006263 [Perkinsus chesapeaki]|uniref:Amine oxidase domain-containing protein n=1 Tax=Perkinsus chesapeaki TaxID=330153 RepID=A0A7J6LSS9_PERCH|nr:hypothetical protein FOL47_006263 [Perkinsus chesapeaki]